MTFIDKILQEGISAMTLGTVLKKLKPQTEQLGIIKITPFRQTGREDISIYFKPIKENIDYVIAQMKSWQWFPSFLVGSPKGGKYSDALRAKLLKTNTVDQNKIMSRYPTEGHCISITFKKEVDKKAPPKTFLWHVSPYENLTSIKKNGLMLKSGSKRTKLPPRIFLDESAKEATELAELLARNSKATKYALFKVNVKGMQLFVDP